MKNILKNYQEKLNWFNDRLSKNTNNGSIEDVRRSERLITSKSLLTDFVADLESDNNDHIAMEWKIKVDRKKELAQRHKDTRYEAIEIIQNKLKNLDVNKTINEFAEHCIRDIHNIKEK